MKHSMMAAISVACIAASGTASAYSVETIDTAVNQADVQSLATYATDSDTAYARAYASYRLAILQMTSQQLEQVTPSLEQALEQLDSQSDSESYVLRAAVVGLQMGLDPINAAQLVERQQTYLARADELDAENPRADIVRGMAAFYTPAAYGGGPEKAQRYFNQALTKFAQPCYKICWGEAEAHTWSGLVYEQQEQPQKAHEQWQQALLIDSDYGWAHYLLGQAADSGQH